MKDSLLLDERAGKEFRFPIPDVMPRSSGEDEAPLNLTFTLMFLYLILLLHALTWFTLKNN